MPKADLKIDIGNRANVVYLEVESFGYRAIFHAAVCKRGLEVGFSVSPTKASPNQLPNLDVFDLDDDDFVDVVIENDDKNTQE